MRPTICLLALYALFALGACSNPAADFRPGYNMASPPLIDPVYDDRELHTQPLDPSRKVSDQDCSQPIDTAKGNLRCK
jgi:hypothetical protein